MTPLFRLTLFVPFLLGGCASSRNSEPQLQSSSTHEKQPAAELVVQGQQAAERGDAVRAEQYLSLAIEQGTDRSRVMPTLLRACLESSHLRAALNHAEPYLLEHPEDDPLRYLVANIHLGLGQVVAARRELGLLLQRNPDNPDAHYLLGIIDSESDVESARTHFLSAAKHTQDEDQRVEVQSRLAELRLREGELARAAKKHLGRFRRSQQSRQRS